jgi:predicted peroxiredoxin
MGHVMINNTRGKDDVERASLAFLVGNVALTSGQEATLLLTIEGVWVATKGYTDGLQATGFDPLRATRGRGADHRRGDGGGGVGKRSPNVELLTVQQ